MTILLKVDASIRLADSCTRELTQYFESKWREIYPKGKVIRRCLVSNPIPHLSQSVFDDFEKNQHKKVSTLSDTLVSEVQKADHILIGSPLYNFNISSTLKAYLDHVVRAGKTFKYDDGDLQGLLNGTRATIITARGGVSLPDRIDDFQTRYLKQIMAFIGVTDVDMVSVEGTSIDQVGKENELQNAKCRIDELFEPFGKVIWRGTFSHEDKKDIMALRLGQANAILNGDAEAYASLCTDDIQLLLPEKEIVIGKEVFQRVEKALFEQVTFVEFRKQPLSIERSGDLVVEVGNQYVKVDRQKNLEGVFSLHQKYTHIFRSTPEGWRFSVLMSNPNE